MSTKVFTYPFAGAVLFCILIFLGNSVSAQGPPQISTENARLHTNFHSGVHSGEWTLKREEILEEESKDPHRSCTAPYCNRCSKHLADYGHEYQFIGGVSQRQLWYRGTIGSIGHAAQRCYDEHGIPYARRGQPAAVMSWEYQHYLNHCIADQLRARTAVAAEEDAEVRVAMLNDLLEASKKRAAASEAIWRQYESGGKCIGVESVCLPCAAVGTANAYYTSQAVAAYNLAYCRAKAQFMKDAAYVADVALERDNAIAEWKMKSVYADERVKLALLSKEDA
ncbi:MAG: hypothetical protein FWE67_05850, partial [Planctomycetaceae bacterium]|nr:hypothetical protein [Planctomycetaceae bacterium]